MHKDSNHFEIYSEIFRANPQESANNKDLGDMENRELINSSSCPHLSHTGERMNLMKTTAQRLRLKKSMETTEC